jgi:hypothetical protein
MKNHPSASPTKKTLRIGEKALVWNLEIIDDGSSAETSLWTGLGSAFGPLLETGRNAVEAIYASVAQVVLERKEELEDWRAERRANHLKAIRVKAVRVANGAQSQDKPDLPKTHLGVVARRKPRVASATKSRG